jgi:hypothetical protein
MVDAMTTTIHKGDRVRVTGAGGRIEYGTVVGVSNPAKGERSTYDIRFDDDTYADLSPDQVERDR